MYRRARGVLPQSPGLCRRRLRAAAAARRHTSPSRFACHLPSRGGFGGASPERCCRTNGFPQSLSLCRGRCRAVVLLYHNFPQNKSGRGNLLKSPGGQGDFLTFAAARI